MSRLLPTTRLEAFSDGVFAIAITLLILEVRVPDAGPEGLSRALWHEWPAFASYAVSFLVIGVIWVNHHTMFDEIVRADRVLLFLNLLLLMAVAFIPFPTALLARYVRSGGADAQTAAVVYSVTMTVMGALFTAVQAYAARDRNLRADTLAAHQVRGLVRRSLAGVLVYGASIVVALFSAPATLAIYAVVAICFGLPHRRRAPGGTA